MSHILNFGSGFDTERNMSVIYALIGAFIAGVFVQAGFGMMFGEAEPKNVLFVQKEADEEEEEAEEEEEKAEKPDDGDVTTDDDMPDLVSDADDDSECGEK